MSFICHIHNYTEYNEQWNVFSAFNPSKCTHLEQWAADCAAPGEQSWTSCRSRDSNPQPWVTSGQVSSPTLYPLGQRLPVLAFGRENHISGSHFMRSDTESWVVRREHESCHVSPHRGLGQATLWQASLNPTNLTQSWWNVFQRLW